MNAKLLTTHLNGTESLQDLEYVNVLIENGNYYKVFKLKETIQDKVERENQQVEINRWFEEMSKLSKCPISTPIEVIDTY